jgi:hypothetical protein
MRQVTALFALMLLVLVGAWCQEKPQNTPPPAKPIDDLAWLIGGVWTADASKMGGGMQRIETRYEWSDNHTFLRFNTHFVTDKATLHRYDGQFFWDPQEAALKMWYMDAHNDITQGLVTVHGDVFDFGFRGTNFEGKPADLKVQLLRKNNDRYVWQLSEKGTQGWQQLASLEYVRGA